MIMSVARFIATTMQLLFCIVTSTLGVSDYIDCVGFPLRNVFSKSIMRMRALPQKNPQDCTRQRELFNGAGSEKTPQIFGPPLST